MPDLGRALGRLRRIGWRHPEWWVVAVALAAWALLAGLAAAHASHPHMSHGMLGMVAMVAAMMLPLTLANVRHVALSSLWRRRHRAIAAFLAGYLAVWIAVQAGITGGWRLLASFAGWQVAVGATVIVAALWEISPARIRRLRRCHRTVPLAPRGWRADADCALYGVTTGLSCVAMCWAIMAACVAFAHSLPVMAVLFGVQVSGRYQRRPVPALAALAVLAAGLLR